MGIQLDIKNVEFPGLFRNVAILHGNESSPQALGPLPSGIDDFDQGRPLHDRRFVRSLTSQKRGSSTSVRWRIDSQLSRNFVS